MTPGPGAAAARADVAASCGPHLPELQRIVQRCVGDEASAAAVVLEIVARITAGGALPPAEQLRRVLFRGAHDVLLERSRQERARGPRPAPSPVRIPPS